MKRVNVSQLFNTLRALPNNTRQIIAILLLATTGIMLFNGWHNSTTAQLVTISDTSAPTTQKDASLADQHQADASQTASLTAGIETSLKHLDRTFFRISPETPAEATSATQHQPSQTPGLFAQLGQLFIQLIQHIVN